MLIIDEKFVWLEKVIDQRRLLSQYWWQFRHIVAFTYVLFSPHFVCVSSLLLIPRLCLAPFGLSSDLDSSDSAIMQPVYRKCECTSLLTFSRTGEGRNWTSSVKTFARFIEILHKPVIRMQTGSWRWNYIISFWLELPTICLTISWICFNVIMYKIHNIMR